MIIREWSIAGMGEFLERVSERGRNPEAVAHRVALFLSKEDRRAIIVEAGDDVLFYGVMLRRTVKSRRTIEFFQAQGRSLVVRALEILLRMKKRGAFAIIDRDFEFGRSPLTNDGHCLTTTYHSAENYLADPDCLIDTGKGLLALEFESKGLEAWVRACAEFSSKIGTILRDEHAVAVAAHQYSKVCFLSNFRIKDYIKVESSGKFHLEPGIYDNFIRVTGVEVDVEFLREVSLHRRKIEEMEWRVWFRGHYFWVSSYRFPELI